MVFGFGKAQDEGDSMPPSPSIAASPYWGKSASAKASKPEGFSPLVGFCFTINYILGTGFLTVPWAFAQGGLALSTIVIVTVGVFSDMSKNYLLETMARAEAMMDDQMRWIKRKPGDEDKQSSSASSASPKFVYSPVVSVARGDTESDLLRSAAILQDYNSTNQASRSYCELGASSLPGTPKSAANSPGGRRLRLLQTVIPKATPKQKYLVKSRKFEVNSLCRVFAGKPGLRVYTGVLSLYIYCTLWAYTCVFSSAMSAAFPVFGDGDEYEDANYLVFAVAFAVMVVPMSCMEMDEQVKVQVTMTGARFLMLALMLGTSSLCAQDILSREEAEPGATVFVEAPMFQFSGISKMAPIMVFAHVFHHSVPGLSHPIADKKKLSVMFRSTIVFVTLAYTLIGLILASTFGADIAQSSNLNWKHFTGGTAVRDYDGRVISVALWARATALYVLCFPALDVVSAFPLNAITLGNNVMGAVYGKRIHEVEQDRWIRTRFRLLASIPPIIFGILERELGTITDYAGTTGLVIGFSFPALLYVRSRALAERKHFSTSTYYSAYSSSKILGWFLFAFGLMMVAYVVYFLIEEENADHKSRKQE